MSHNQNITRIKAVHHALGELAKDVVFVGGATVSLYSTRPITETRPTDDVDIVIELLNYTSYTELDQTLRNKGFINDQHSGVICRYMVQGIIVDVMPTTNDILGFANKWYPEAYAYADTVLLDDEINIQIFSAPYFIASKIEAFLDRGAHNGRTSTDFEDIVHVLNNREQIWDQLNAISGELRDYLKEKIAKLVAEKYIDEWISSHLEYSEQGRVTFIMDRLHDFVSNR